MNTRKFFVGLVALGLVILVACAPAALRHRLQYHRHHPPLQ